VAFPNRIRRGGRRGLRPPEGYPIAKASSQETGDQKFSANVPGLSGVDDPSLGIEGGMLTCRPRLKVKAVIAIRTLRMNRAHQSVSSMVEAAMLTAGQGSAVHSCLRARLTYLSVSTMNLQIKSLLWG